jgi:LysM repeat protein
MLLAGRVALGMVGDGPLSAPHQAPPVLVSERIHVVQPGDTLWSIARTLQPEGDVRRLVQQLSSQLDGAGLQVGQRIVLP